MKSFLCVLVLLLAATRAIGQDSLGTFYQGQLTGEKVLAFVDDLIVTQEWVQELDYGGFNFVVIKDNSEPTHPRELWRGSPVFYRVGDMSFNGPGFIQDVVLHGSEIIVLHAKYSTTDVEPFWSIGATLEIFNWRQNRRLARIEWEGEPEVEWLLPGGLDVLDDYLFAGLGSFGTHVYDISNPSEITEVFQSESIIGAPSIYENHLLYNKYRMVDDTITVTLTSAEFDREAIQINEVDSITVLEWPWPLWGPWLSGSVGNYLNYVFFSGLKTIQLQEDGSLDSIGTCDFIRGRFTVDDGLLYCQTGNVLQISDFSNPLEPRFIESRSDSASMATMPFTVNRGYIYRMRKDPNPIWDNNASDRHMYLFHRGALDVSNDSNTAPTGFNLHPPYPNPFNSKTTINYELPQTVNILIDVLDINGRSLLHLNRSGEVGDNHISIDGANLPSGAYLIQLETPTEMQSRQVNLVR